jgi:predicted nucleic acid-binding protein
VDTSVWIDFFNSTSGLASRELRRLIDEGGSVALTGIVVTEVLQGLSRNVNRIDSYLSSFAMLEPRGISTYREAAAISRLARSNGFSLTTVDTLIAAIAIEHQAALFTLDKDFSSIARFTSLRLHRLPAPAD